MVEDMEWKKIIMKQYGHLYTDLLFKMSICYVFEIELIRSDARVATIMENTMLSCQIGGAEL